MPRACLRLSPLAGGRSPCWDVTEPAAESGEPSVLGHGQATKVPPCTRTCPPHVRELPAHAPPARQNCAPGPTWELVLMVM